MSARKTEQEVAVRHPRETADLFGHREAEMALLNAYRSGRIPHAWLIGGPQGIGKATLAYRMARFVLANSKPMTSSVQRAETLALDPNDPVARQITAGAHGGLLVLERGLNDRGVMRTVITVDETRETISFFGSTAAVDGWRVCIVDTVDELNPNAANALLKILEEPPQRSLFFLVSHSPARALPTILSRCRKLPLRPLVTDDVIRAATVAGMNCWNRERSFSSRATCSRSQSVVSWNDRASEAISSGNITSYRAAHSPRRIARLVSSIFSMGMHTVACVRQNSRPRQTSTRSAVTFRLV